MFNEISYDGVWFENDLIDACKVKINVKYVCYVTPRPSKIEASHVRDST